MLEELYIIVTYPTSQFIVDKPWFDECFMVVTEYLGPLVYAVPKKYKEIIEEERDNLKQSFEQ